MRIFSIILLIFPLLVSAKIKEGACVTAWKEVQRKDSLHKVYNESIFLQQKPDTMKYFLNVRDLMIACEHLDSVDEKGRYKNRAASIMRHNWSNLLAGGHYFYKKQDWDKAWSFLTMASESPFVSDELKYVPWQYWLTISAFHLKNPKGVLKYIDKAFDEVDSSVHQKLQENKCHCFLALRDTAGWRVAMETGYRLYPDSRYFTTYANYVSGLQLCNSALSCKSQQEAIECYRKALPLLEEVRKQWPDAIDKWGICLYRIYLNLNMGVEFDEMDELLKKSGY